MTYFPVISLKIVEKQFCPQVKRFRLEGKTNTSFVFGAVYGPAPTQTLTGEDGQNPHHYLTSLNWPSAAEQNSAQIPL